MLAFVPMANSLERLVGSVQFLHMLLLFTALEGVIYVAAAYALTLGHVYPGANMSCAVGFSGVIFGLIVVDNAQSNAATRSIFGLFTVPAQLYPWALLVFWQLLMPSVSFLGHLAGVLVGQLWVWNMLRPLALPRTTTVWLEQSRALSTAVRLPSFMMMPGGAGMPYTTHAGGSDAGGTGGSSGAGASGARGGGGGGGGGGGLVKSFAALKGMWRPNGSGATGGEAAGGDDVEAAAGAAGGSGSRPAVFQGTGRVLGSSSSSSGSAAPPALPPSSAAAMAAEARMGGGGGGAGSSGGGGGAAGVGRTASSNDRAGPRP
ncbi:hypothetical protein HYH03_017237 [Edaphochlamys debaryana]|uniref:Peptidase S54 rhomboid domain-containing protein n=1 Tax=Edaphochlamys debaryana TaxID=47281 RepID=A0A835XHK3_9CHLO|nr:hypothetical protein HYH03_017237 [Edaphochlamys debaryana]|eukprot:KAG2483916.1 hypothetical protein HYH03_017237 [Edaphochlamys debaryana]